MSETKIRCRTSVTIGQHDPAEWIVDGVPRCTFCVGIMREDNPNLIAEPFMAITSAPSVPPEPAAKISSEDLARRFHETYERLAPDFGYETRRESAKPWAEVPEQNRALMVAVCAELLTGPAAPSEPVPDGPRVLAIPEWPKDWKAFRDAQGFVWRLDEADDRWRRSTGAWTDDPLRMIVEHPYLAPLTEVVEESTP